MPEVFVGLGTNFDRQRHLAHAVAALARRFGPVRVSGVYVSAAVGGAAQDYWNAVAAWPAEVAPTALVAVLREIESETGRVRGTPVTSLDLDLLVYGALVAPALRVPRADVLSREFVLAPLAELAPELAHPVTGERLAAAWASRAARLPPVERLGPLA